MQEYAVLVPQQYNNGQNVAESVRDSIESRLLATFGGYTDDGSVRGVWRDDTNGIVYVDTNTRYLVAAAQESDVIEFAAYVADVLEQEAVYVRCPDNSVRFVERSVALDVAA